MRLWFVLASLAAVMPFGIAMPQGGAAVPVVVVTATTVSTQVPAAGTSDRGCDGHPLGTLRYIDGRLQLCRE